MRCTRAMPQREFGTTHKSGDGGGAQARGAAAVQSQAWSLFSPWVYQKTWLFECPS